MATLKRELREILERYSIDPRDKSKLWDCHGTLVLYHRAYEIIAAQEGIVFDPPTIIESNGADKIVALLVTGRMKERTEWSIGEAAPGNSKNAYPYAIAEKRAKDRVVGKLVGLAAHVYSEDEADDFRSGGAGVIDEPAQAPQTPAGEPTAAPPSSPPSNGHAAPAARAGLPAANPEEPPEVAASREEMRRLLAVFRAAPTPETIEDKVSGIWVVNAAAIADIKKHGGDAAFALLSDTAQKRLNQLRAPA